MQKLNYSEHAAAAPAGADAAVGVAIPDIADPFFAAMTASIEVTCGRGMAVVVTSLRQARARRPPSSRCSGARSAA